MVCTACMVTMAYILSSMPLLCYHHDQHSHIQVLRKLKYVIEAHLSGC